MEPNSVVIEMPIAGQTQKEVNYEVEKLNTIRRNRRAAREMLTGVLEKDSEYKNVADEKRRVELNLKVRRNKLVMDDPTARATQEKIERLNDEYKVAKGRVSAALINYWAKTNTTSLPTPSGKMIDFERVFSIKNAQLKLFE